MFEGQEEKLYSCGYWPIFVCDLVLDCMRNSNKPMPCCIVFSLKAKYIPLFVTIVLFAFMRDYSILSGFLIGYIIYAFQCLNIGDERATHLE